VLFQITTSPAVRCTRLRYRLGLELVTGVNAAGGSWVPVVGPGDGLPVPFNGAHWTKEGTDG
jgi:hypothetical protein